MSREPRQFDFASMFSIDVSPTAPARTDADGTLGEVMVGLLRQIVDGQHKQNDLLEELLENINTSQKQRHSELGQWKDANPELATACRDAAETLGKVQSQFLHTLTEEVAENAECLMDGEYMLTEFVDRFGPRLAHLNGVLQVLSQLSNVQNSTNAVS